MTTLQSANGAMTSQQRRNYIDTVRRMQPLDDLLRKAKKANRRGWRRTYAGIEGLDYLFARDWRWHLERHATTVATFRLTFCSLCRKFADVGQPVKHKPRCSRKQSAARILGSNIFQEAADRIEALEAALKPFAEFAEHVAQDLPGWDHDRFVMAIGICEHDDLRWSWFRAARSALKDTEA